MGLYKGVVVCPHCSVQDFKQIAVYVQAADWGHTA